MMLPDRNQSRGCTRRVLDKLKKLPPVSSAAVETLQFYTGLLYLQYLNDKVLGFISSESPIPEVLAIFYFAQAFYYYQVNSDDGLDTIDKVFKGERTVEWEELSWREAIPANMASFAFNGWALVSDINQTAYFIYKQGWNLSKPASFVMSSVACSSNLLMEALDSHMLLRKQFSGPYRAFKAAGKHIRKTAFYTAASSEFRAGFDELWEKDSSIMDLKMALRDETRKDFIEDPNYLADTFCRIFSLENAREMKEDLVISFGIDNEIAETFVNKLCLLKQPLLAPPEEKEEKEEKNNYYHRARRRLKACGGELGKKASMLNTVVETTLQACGGAQDTFESYASTASILPALLGITDNSLLLFVFLSSWTNGASDVVFYGRDACDKLRNFRKALADNRYGHMEEVMFMCSVFLAVITAHAAFSLLIGMASDNETALPKPLPPALPEWLSFLLGSGAALRTFIIDAGANYGMFDLIRQKWNERKKTAVGSVAEEKADVIIPMQFAADPQEPAPSEDNAANVPTQLCWPRLWFWPASHATVTPAVDEPLLHRQFVSYGPPC